MNDTHILKYTGEEIDQLLDKVSKLEDTLTKLKKDLVATLVEKKALNEVLGTIDLSLTSLGDNINALSSNTSTKFNEVNDTIEGLKGEDKSFKTSLEGVNNILSEVLSPMSEDSKRWKDLGIDTFLSNLVIFTPEYGKQSNLDVEAFTYIVERYGLKSRVRRPLPCLFKREKSEAWAFGSLVFSDNDQYQRIDITVINGFLTSDMSDIEKLYNPDYEGSFMNLAYLYDSTSNILMTLGMGKQRLETKFTELSRKVVELDTKVSNILDGLNS